jgi:anti-anti-sigma regulatory factor
MKITITKIENPAPIAILHLDGTLDGGNYKSLIDEAQDVYDAGSRELLLDLGKLTFISSAGLAALHQVALLFQGKKHSEPDESWAAYRWAAYHSIDRLHNRRAQEHVKLLSPTKEVREVLDLTGFGLLFEIFTDLHQALASFHQAAPATAARLP